MNTSILRLIGVLAIAIIGVTLPRAVTAAAPDGHYVVTDGSETGTGTVYDTRSKLTWQKTVSSTVYTWADAKTYCAGLGTSLGGTGWRLPTLKELYSIVDLSRSVAPYIDPNAFPSTPSTAFWSASPVACPRSNAWRVNFRNGNTDLDSYMFDTGNVRCVR
jgi:hypothetical protein